jgi:DNA processing protein
VSAAAGAVCRDCLGLVEEWDGGPLGDCWAVCRCSAEYPEQLLELDDRTPPVLFGLGERAGLRRLQRDLTVTIVGSRRATRYGTSVAGELGNMLGAAGLTVVSGMAFGIDSAAHEGTLDGGGATVAVLGGGPDVAYPPSKRALHGRIASSGGVLLSERPPGIRPEKWSFPARNRIMAALARTVIVVEAALPSGTMITAEEATRLHRDLGAVPGPVTSRTSAGTNELIREGAALVRDAQDVLDEILGVGATAAVRVGPNLAPELAATLTLVEAGNTTVDLVARAGSGDPRSCAVALARLELMGYIQGGAYGVYARTSLSVPADR